MNTIEQRRVERWIPKESRVVERPGLNAVAYLYERGGKCLAIAYEGNARNKAWHYSFKDESRRDEYVIQWLGEASDRQARRAASLSAKQTAKAGFNAAEHYAVGDVLHSCWGYDQTNVEWYEVTAVRAKSIQIREINCVEQETGFMSGDSYPMPGQFAGPAIWRTVQVTAYNGQVSHHIKAPIHGNLYKDDGKLKKAVSWGH